MTALQIAVRTATAADIPAMHRIRLAVGENQLSETSGIGPSSYFPHLEAGRVWAAEAASDVVGFAIVDAIKGSVWALFVDPAFEGHGAGRALHERMLDWSRGQGVKQLWLTTGPGTRAATFYRRLGWVEAGRTSDGEIRFERLL